MIYKPSVILVNTNSSLGLILSGLSEKSNYTLTVDFYKKCELSFIISIREVGMISLLKLNFKLVGPNFFGKIFGQTKIRRN